MKRLFLNEHLRSKFGERVQRIPLDPGFKCPNRKDSGGCVFCDNNGSAALWIPGRNSITEQMDFGASIARRRYRSKKYIAYFQAFTPTAAPVAVLKKLYDEAISYPGVVGLAISTRPDAISEEVLSLINDYAKKVYVWVELGAQSMEPKSLLWMNRGHGPDAFNDAVSRLSKIGVEAVGHIIFGLPTETKERTIASFKQFLASGISGYKIHALHIIKDTELALMYEKDKFNLLSMDEYIALVKEAVTLTPEDIVIHRLTAETTPDRLIAPAWVINKNEILRRIHDELGI